MRLLIRTPHASAGFTPFTPFTRSTRFISLVLCLALLATSLLPGLTPPASAMLGSFTIADELELGRKYNALIKSRLPLVEDPEVADYVAGLVQRLLKTMPTPPFTITTSVIRETSMNAFAAPAGYVYVNTGLILALENEDELAGVLAHELAHVTQRHLAERIEQAQMISIGSLLAMLAGALLGGGKGGEALVVGPMAAGQAAMLSYSRENEREADQIGLNYILSAKFDPNGMVRAFETFKRRRWHMGGNTPGWLVTHPGLDERISYLSDRVAGLPAAQRKAKSDNAGFERARTIVRARLTDPGDARKYYDGLAKPSCMDRLGAAIVASRQNRVQDARSGFDMALGCGGGDPLYLREAGRFQYQFGDAAKAGKLLQEALAKNPGDLMALFFYARLLGESGRPDEAVGYMRRILKKLPEDAEVHSELGRLIGQKGDVFSAHVHLAYAAVYSNNKKQARFHMEKAEGLRRTETQREDFAALKKAYDDRAEFWPGGA